MANYRNCGCNSGCGCSSGCKNCGSRRRCPNCSGRANAETTCFGALNRVAGPFARGGNDVSYYGNDAYLWENYPYYTGPCGPCEPCERCCCPDLPWPPPRPCPPPRPPFVPASASFTSATPLNVDVGGTVTLTPDPNNPASLSSSNGGVLIQDAGIYLVTYTVQAPDTQTINSQFYLTLNGQTLGNSTLSVNATGPSSTSMHTIVQAPANSTLLLKPGSAVNLTASTGVPFTMSIARIA